MTRAELTICEVDDALCAELYPLVVVDGLRKAGWAIFFGLIWLTHIDNCWVPVLRRYWAKSTANDRFQAWAE